MSTNGKLNGEADWYEVILPVFLSLVVILVLVMCYRQMWSATVDTRGRGQEQTWQREVTKVLRRRIPLDIRPTGAFKDLIDEEELAPIVAMVDPCWTGADVGVMLHSLRLWGTQARFDSSWQVPGQPPLYVFSAPEQVKILLDHKAFEMAFRRNYTLPAVLNEGEVGVAVTTNLDADFGAYQGQFHPDKLLQVLAEIGVPASQSVSPRLKHSRQITYTVDDIVKESLWMYSSRQEPDFTASAYSRWLRSPATWKNRFGEIHRLEDIVERLLAREFGEGACMGSHVFYALASVYRANQVEPLVSKEKETSIARRLSEVSVVLARRQHVDGSWSEDWAKPVVKEGPSRIWYLDVDPYPKIVSTGHHLEWISLAPPELCPPRDVIAKAVNYLKLTLSREPRPFFCDTSIYPLSTHAVRALCQIGMVNAWDVEQKFHAVPRGAEILSVPTKNRGN